jgi:hypothetical protein
LLSHFVPVKTEARSQPSNLLEPSCNRVSDGRFASAGVAVKPEHARGVVLSAIDPGSDLVKDFSTSTLQTGFLDV